MEKRKLNDGTVIARLRSPQGHGHSYYVDGGPEGMVLITDTFLTPSPYVASALAWDLEGPTCSQPHTPALEFNKHGFRY